MSHDVDATWANAPGPTDPPEYDAADLRRADAALVAGAGVSGFNPLGGIAAHDADSLAVTVDGSDNLTVQPGTVIIPCDAVAGGGVYRAGLPASYSEALPARHATNSRIDLVVFRMLDTDVVGTHPARTGRVELIAGTPAGSPVVPTKPTLAVELARITVPATGGGAATVNSTFRVYTAALGGKIRVSSAARLPSDAVPGQDAIALDTRREYQWTGTIWEPKKVTGTKLVSFTALSLFTVRVDFGETFADAPTVVTNIGSTAGGTQRWTSRAYGIDTTGFGLLVAPGDGVAATWANVPVGWLATPSN